MFQKTTSSTVLLCLVSLLAFTASARHAHRRPLHRHAVRAESSTSNIAVKVDLQETPVSILPAPVPSFTAGDAVLDDILEIQSGLNDLPKDLMAIISTLEHRLEEVEKVLAGYLDGPAPNTGSDSPVGPVGPVILPRPSVVTPATDPTETSLPADISEATSTITLEVNTPASSTTPTSSLCRPLGGAGPLRPCGEPDVTASRTQTTRSTSITRTMTLMTTIPPPLATGVKSNETFPAMNGTDFTPPAPWPKPYLVSGAITASAVSGSMGSTPVATTLSESETSSPSEPTSSYTFDAQSSDNVAVYFGQNVKSDNDDRYSDLGLASLCASPNVDIVILSFLSSFFDASGFPTLNIAGCTSQTPLQSASAPGLQDCTPLAREITTCQSQHNKKILLSLGGYTAQNTSFTSSSQATTLATTLWDLFGAGTGLDPALRPFGPDVVLDGFDLDNETGDTEHYAFFAAALRSQFALDSSKTYYLSAAPQCPVPDASLPLAALQLADFVWVQFYNNPACNIDSAGFQASFRAWSDSLSSGGTSGGGPKLYIGAAGFEGAGSGYVKGSGLGTRVRTARELYVDNLGGVMVWHGSEAGMNVDQYGVDYLEYAKEALH